MNDSRRYRAHAADCLLAAQDAQRLCDRQLRLSMANSWLSLARQDEAMRYLLARDTGGPVETWGTASNPFVSGNRL